MAAIRSKDTRPERVLRSALRSRGLAGYRCHLRLLPGKPDIAFTRWRVAVFIDGAFWHGHPDHFTFGRLGGYWDEKILKTQRRDRVQAAALEAAGYEVLRFWDFEVVASPGDCAAVVQAAIQARQHDAGVGES
jgi:DNA mismatch endonuclease, patch repair protein